MALALWQGELTARSFTFGAGTDYEIAAAGPSGLGVSVRSFDANRIGNGSTAGTDSTPSRELLVPLHVGKAGDDHLDAGALVQALRAAWRPLRTGEMRLDLWAPGVLTTEVGSFFGRPRGVDLDLALIRSGYASALARFAATDPLVYGPLVVSPTDSSSPLAIDDATLGPEDTYRATLTIVGNDGTPTVTNATTGGVIDFAEQLDTADVAVIDLYTRSVVVESLPAPEVVDPASTWFGLAGGVDNSITFTGCASIQLTYRPAYP